jgi:hypothetical protein
MPVVNRVTTTQRLKWKAIGYPMHFIGRHKCSFRLGTLLERKIIVSTIGHYLPNDGEPKQPLAGHGPDEVPDSFFETIVFTVASFMEDGTPLIGKQLAGSNCATAIEAQKLHDEMCVKFQLELNMGMHR